jgi:hypothetical protein
MDVYWCRNFNTGTDFKHQEIMGSLPKIDGVIPSKREFKWFLPATALTPVSPEGLEIELETRGLIFEEE